MRCGGMRCNGAHTAGDSRPVTVIASSHNLGFFSAFDFVLFLANRTLAEWARAPLRPPGRPPISRQPLA